MSAQTPTEDELQPNIGPIPLAAFIALCLFAPFFVSFTIWLFYINIIKRCRNRKRIEAETETKDPGADVTRDVEMQVARFVQAPAPAKTKIRKQEVW